MGVHKTQPNLEGPLSYSHKQMWVNLIAAGVGKKKIDEQPNANLVQLWKQLPKDKRFQPLPLY